MNFQPEDMVNRNRETTEVRRCWIMRRLADDRANESDNRGHDRRHSSDDNWSFQCDCGEEGSRRFEAREAGDRVDSQVNTNKHKA